MRIWTAILVASLVGDVANASDPTQHAVPLPAPATVSGDDLVIPDELVVDRDDGDVADAVEMTKPAKKTKKKTAKCKSSNKSCRPSVHKGTGCSGGGCDCGKGEICSPNSKARPGSPFSGKCVCA